MTREEAKEVLLNRGYIQVKGGRIYDGDKWRQSIVVISKWLEQEPCKDCINRQAVLDMVEDMTDQFGNKHRVVTEGMISLLPPVTPKPKTEVLDKIRAEIEQLTSRYSISKERGGIGIVEWSDRLIKESDVLQIIDKYKAESEDKE